jgi:hypothetical protein
MEMGCALGCLSCACGKTLPKLYPIKRIYAPREFSPNRFVDTINRARSSRLWRTPCSCLEYRFSPKSRLRAPANLFPGINRIE